MRQTTSTCSRRLHVTRPNNVALLPKDTNRWLPTCIVGLLMLASIQASACFNYYVVDENGNGHVHHEHPPRWGSSDFEAAKKELVYYEHEIPLQEEKWKPMYLSNYSIALAKVGRYSEAQQILEQLRRALPDEYRIAANLAVVYELNGELDQALAMLDRALKLDPDSHHSSEWIHKQILQGAITLRDSGADLQSTKILTFPADQESIHSIPHHVVYQLQERVPLTTSPNQYFSKVLEEIADYYRVTISLEWAMELYSGALGYSADTTVNERLWSKLETAQAKLAVYHGKIPKKTRDVLRDFSKPDWKDKVDQRIARLRSRKPEKYMGQVRTDFTPPKPEERTPAANWR
ncbi:MAG: tetratricopeptide repeat protein [Chitinophagaceae bacterium]|nr:MAG: tetratricopeptide repeat protein [Chitinophagaceae bacterium]